MPDLDADTRCRHCAQRVKLCPCGFDAKPHWVDVGYGSRWCRPMCQLHEPITGEVADHA